MRRVAVALLILVSCKSDKKEPAAAAPDEKRVAPDARAMQPSDAAAAAPAAPDATAAPAPPDAAAPTAPWKPGKITAHGYTAAKKLVKLKKGEHTYFAGMDNSIRWEPAAGGQVDVVVVYHDDGAPEARFVAVTAAGETDLGEFVVANMEQDPVVWTEIDPGELVVIGPAGDVETEHGDELAAIRLTWDGSTLAVADRWMGRKVTAKAPAWVRAASSATR